MKAVALAVVLALVPTMARGQGTDAEGPTRPRRLPSDKPLALRIAAGALVGVETADGVEAVEATEGYFLNVAGYEKLDAKVAEFQRHAKELEVENEILRGTVTARSFESAVVIAAVALVAGVFVGAKVLR